MSLNAILLCIAITTIEQRAVVTQPFSIKLEVLTGIATLHEEQRHDSHKADEDRWCCYRALRIELGSFKSFVCETSLMVMLWKRSLVFMIKGGAIVAIP